VLERLADTPRDHGRLLHLGRAQVEHAEDDGLRGQRGQDREIQARLGRLDRDLIRRAAVQLREDEYPLGLSLTAKA